LNCSIWLLYQSRCVYSMSKISTQNNQRDITWQSTNNPLFKFLIWHNCFCRNFCLKNAVWLWLASMIPKFIFSKKISTKSVYTELSWKKSTHDEWTNTILWFLQHFFKNLCKHLTQKVFQKNPCPDLITKSFIEKQTCLSKKNHRLKCVFHCFKKKLIHNNSPPPLFLAIPILSFETVEESFGSPTFLFAWFEHLLSK